jgi:secondary thiamine-phosphate synthase enzyme
MTVAAATLEFVTTDDTDILDVTQEAAAFVHASEVSDGILVLFTPGSTAGVTTIEFESGAVSDLKRALDLVAPRHEEYEHNRRWGDGNGHSHVRAAMLGPSLTVPVLNGRLDLGTWQQIVLCDFDNRPRRRRLSLQVIGN